MKEVTIIVIITSILIIGGIISVQLSSQSLASQDFNFYKSELTIDGTKVNEKLYYKPDKSYHTLFRNFLDPVYSQINPNLNSVYISDVSCSEGRPYYKTIFGTCLDNSIEFLCPAYTEPNEYGCTFGNSFGFFINNYYTISASFEIIPENIFLINEKRYVKFVVYSSNNHYKLTKENFIIVSSQNIVKKDVYSIDENVIVYIPYEGSINGKKIIPVEKFDFDNANNKSFFNYLVSLIPAFVFFFSWYLFGRENLEKEIPEQMSLMPNEKNKRKPWQVAAYFNPPFSTIDKNVFSSTLLNFYHKKVIDIKIIEDEIYIKTNQSHNYKLDEVELQIFNIIKLVEDNANDKYKEKGYVNLKSAPKDFFNFTLKFQLQNSALKLQKEVKSQGKEFLSLTGIYVLIVGLFISIYPLSFAGLVFMFPLLFITILTTFLLNFKTALFSKHKGEFYSEYQHWQAFKKYLSRSFTIREGTHKTLAIWSDYLVYSAALGVSKKVIRELKANHLINAQQERIFLSTHGISTSLVSSSGLSGGHGGAGGGGVGGGGGGGR